VSLDYASLREHMITGQLIPRGISDKRVLAAFKKVPRHEFVPAEERDDSYGDFPLPIGESQTISQPYMVALMTELLKLTGTEKILEVGTGSGYQAAILAELAAEVYSIERIQTLADGAHEVLARLGYNNVTIAVGDGTMGLKKNAPYDAIMVTAGAPDIPKELIEQLGEGGRLVVPQGGCYSQRLTLVTKRKNKIEATDVCGCVFVPLIGKAGWTR
jgi:protein-L-isoaspartate(D-aspartate) O-methyltransferase